jgi:hypothetical protein
MLKSASFRRTKCGEVPTAFCRVLHPTSRSHYLGHYLSTYPREKIRIRVRACCSQEFFARSFSSAS